MTTVSDKFWLNDISILFRQDRLLEFWITGDQTNTEKLNSITRFGVYASIILSLYQRNPRYLFLIILTVLITFFIYKFSVKDTEIKEQFEEQQKTVEPTYNNIFGNPLPGDDPKRPPMIKYYKNDEPSEKIRKEIEDKYSFNLFKDISDIYENQNGQREFYTVASTTNPPDADGEFRKWITEGVTSCKLDRYACRPYEDLRYNRKDLNTIMEEDDENLD